jgi:beta-aspartyl-peptidase (threonine type)
LAAIIVHGGAGGIRGESDGEALVLAGVREACIRGFKAMKGGGNAIDAVEEAVKAMEDNPIFDAGIGSFLNLAGEVEMDASIMASDLSCGAVAAIKRVRHPISVARAVMERTDHVLLAGDGATFFARILGFEEADLVTEERVEMWREIVSSLLSGGGGKGSDIARLYIELGNPKDPFGTVGAVAMDDKGLIAAGTSTGGTRGKLPGRVGDSPIIGAGTYANEFGGASASGVGEWIIRLGLTRMVVGFIEEGMKAGDAVRRAVEVADRYGCRCGVIAMDKDGNVGCSFNTAAMSRAYMADGMEEPVAEFSSKDGII